MECAQWVHHREWHGNRRWSSLADNRSAICNGREVKSNNGGNHEEEEVWMDGWMPEWHVWLSTYINAQFLVFFNLFNNAFVCPLLFNDDVMTTFLPFSLKKVYWKIWPKLVTAAACFQFVGSLTEMPQSQLSSSSSSLLFFLFSKICCWLLLVAFFLVPLRMSGITTILASHGRHYVNIGKM